MKILVLIIKTTTETLKVEDFKHLELLNIEAFANEDLKRDCGIAFHSGTFIVKDKMVA